MDIGIKVAQKKHIITQCVKQTYHAAQEEANWRGTNTEKRVSGTKKNLQKTKSTKVINLAKK